MSALNEFIGIGRDPFDRTVIKANSVSLLDYLAAAAMQGLLAKHGGYTNDRTNPNSPRCLSEDALPVDELAEYAYIQAAAMLRCDVRRLALAPNPRKAVKP